MMRKNDRNPFVKKWVSRVWDFSEPRPREIVTSAQSEDEISDNAVHHWRVGQQGPEIYCDTNNFANNFYFFTTQGEGDKYHAGYTVLFRLDNLSSEHGVVRHMTSGLTVQTDGSVHCYQGSNTISTSAGAVAANEWHIATIMAQAVSGNDATRMWVDGVYIGETTAAVVSTSGTLRVFADGNISGMKGSVAFLCEHSGSLFVGAGVFPSTDEIARFHANPWQVYAPKTIYAPFVIEPVAETPAEEGNRRLYKLPKGGPVWTRKPPVGTKINFNHRLARGLVAAIPVLGSNDRTTDAGYKDYGPNYFNVNDDGVITFGQDEHGGYIECPTAGGVFIESCKIPQAEATIFIGVRPAVGYTTARLLGSNDAFECNMGSTGTSNQLFHGGASPPAGGQGFAGGEYAELAFIATSGGVSKLVLNGSDEYYYEDILSPSTNNGTTPTATQDMYVGSSRNLADGLEGKVYYFFMFDHAFGVAEAIEFMHNPWQIFEPRPVLGITNVSDDVRFAPVIKPWTKQPPAETKIDWNHPLAKGLLTAIPFNDPGKQTVRAQTRELGIDVGTNPGTNPWSWSGKGTASVLRPPTPATSNALDFDIDAVSSATSGFSVYWLGEFLYNDAMPGGQDLWFVADTENSADGWRITKGNTAIGTAPNEFRFRTGELTNVNFDEPTTWDIGDVMSMTFLWDGAFKRIYRDGIQLDQRAATGTLSYGASSMRVGNQTTGLSYDNATGYQLLLVYDRGLTPDEVLRLHKNPWQIFEPEIAHAPLNEELPKLATFEKPWTSKPS